MRQTRRCLSLLKYSDSSSTREGAADRSR
jgi:hypothetical protein